MENLGTYPFGEKVAKVSQKDRSKKKFFVLGSYASAVHTAWYNISGKVISKSLPVSNEPEILWTGNSFEAMTIINRISIPEDAGRLSDPGRWLNGSVGRIFNAHFLKPLNIYRSDIWMCLLIPFFLANKGQRKALSRYEKLRTQFNLPESQINPSSHKSHLIDENRKQEILNELKESDADTIITLGDMPLHHIIKFYNPEFENLLSFDRYGIMHKLIIDDREYRLLPLYHPKAGENVGSYTQKWRSIHQDWISSTVGSLEI